MVWLKTILLIALATCVICDSSSSEEDDESFRQSLQRFLSDLGWKGEEEDMLAFLKGQYNNLNVTIMAWQNIHDDTGKLKEVRTLELVLPSKANEDEDDEDVDFDTTELENLRDKVVETKDIVEGYPDLGVDVILAKELYFDDASEVYQIVVNNKDVYGSIGGDFSFLNKTIEDAKPEEIDSFIDTHKEKHTWAPVVLRYDEVGKFIEDKSHIVTPIVVSVNEIEDASQARNATLIDEIVDVVGQVGARYSYSVSSQEFQEALDKEIPEYRWNVIQDLDEFYVTKDIGLFVTYDTLDLDTKPRFFIYA